MRLLHWHAHRPDAERLYDWTLGTHASKLSHAESNQGGYESPRSAVIGCKLMGMNLVTHFQMLARYNRIANERLFAKCAQLDDAEYRMQRAG